MNRDYTTHTLRTDGGQSMPGVPDPEDDESDDEDTPDETDTSGSGRAMPGVPKSSSTPSTGPQQSTSTRSHQSTGASQATGGTPERTAQAKSGEGTHGLTTVLTFEALTNLAEPAAVLQDVRSWSDWVGVVGDVDPPTMHTFLRRNDLSVDFFSGPAGPVERLRRVSVTDSSFGSEREVLIGVDDEAQIAEAADWEFQSLESVAAEADWELQ